MSKHDKFIKSTNENKEKTSSMTRSGKRQKKIQKRKEAFLNFFKIKRYEQEDENLQYLSEFHDNDLTFKQKITKRNQYRGKRSIVFILISVVCLFGLVHMIDYLHNEVFVAEDDIALTSESSDLLQMTFVGDVMMDRGLKRKSLVNGYDTLFDKSKNLWRNSDIVAGNLESVVLRDQNKYKENKTKDIHLNMHPDGVQAIKNAGFTTLSTANNHISDYGRKGIKNTMKVLQDKNIDFAGIGANSAGSLNYTTYDINGVIVSFLSVTDVIPEHTTATEDKAGALTTQNDNYLNLINEAAAQSDYTVVYSHWGEEVSESISKRQEELGRDMVDAGADLIVGMHPHVVQPIEKYKNGLIMYSLGNFVFEQEQTRTKDSVVVNYRIDSQGQMKLELVPMRIKDGIPAVTKNPFYKQRIFRQLTKKMDSNQFERLNDTILVKDFGYQFKINRNTE
ncbi:MAG: CapA family protein [Tetragenococcus koreensis]|uniref:CapA family protein n=1 Tax=Tetragenococcus halophilus TaxID=51669 RepID=UPI00077C6E19|nr:CapA family protein [Tetragenococcus halophilus]MDN6140047.1 CapA family protein [Tetragenococcus koreensis]MDN6194269.1 CapA family protein [Alkalibacterium sp.]MDN6270639.1 CapA family protein [Tetragenococcus koreensis]MDN6497547.1 CapA family protein [Tetragenococcus koreensis]MDN6502274.1 CapA family protein [Tetragenococcus koreensis]